MLKASLAERLGRVSVAEAVQREAEEYRTIDQRMHLLRGAVPAGETAAERALRRTGFSGCSMLMRGLLHQPYFGAWCAQAWRLFGGTVDAPRRCDPFPRAEHSLVTAPQVRAFRAEMVGCRSTVVLRHA